jgi:hypothetical protein
LHAATIAAERCLDKDSPESLFARDQRARRKAT